jgi:hypothetical protein
VVEGGTVVPYVPVRKTRLHPYARTSDSSLDALLVVDLPPGVYTATLAGNNNSTGIGLVEVYEIE